VVFVSGGVLQFGFHRFRQVFFRNLQSSITCVSEGNYMDAIVLFTNSPVGVWFFWIFTGVVFSVLFVFFFWLFFAYSVLFAPLVPFSVRSLLVMISVIFFIILLFFYRLVCGGSCLCSFSVGVVVCFVVLFLVLSLFLFSVFFGFVLFMSFFLFLVAPVFCFVLVC